MILNRQDPVGTPDLKTIRLHDPRFYADNDAHSVWKHLRQTSPVHWCDAGNGTGYWVVTRYPDVVNVLSDSKTYTSERGNILTVLGRDDPAGGRMLAVTDPPKHTALKRQINRFFVASAVSRHEAAVRILARRVIAAADAGDSFDFAAASAVYPIAFTALMMGIEEADWHKLISFAYVAIADQDPDLGGHPSDVTLERAHAEIFHYFMTALMDGPPPGTLTDAVATTRIDNKKIDLEEQLFNLYSILLGATVTTSHALNALVDLLADDPELFDAVRCSAASDLPTLVEEVLRWSSPANHFLRHTTTAAVLSGVTIPKDAPVTVWLSSANRDSAIFDNPFEFKPQRRPNKHIAFGVGAHRCLGAPMATLAISVFVDEFFQSVEGVSAAGPTRHLSSNFIAGIKQLPVKFALTTDGRRRTHDVTPFER